VAADNELAVIVRAVVDDFVSGMRTAKTEVKQFAADAGAAFEDVEEKSENLRHVWKDLFEAFIGIEIVNVLKNIADAADDASDRLDIAAQSAKNFGKSFNADAMEQWLRKFSKSAQGGGYAINDMRDAVQRFTAIGLDGAQSERALADSADLAASRHISFAQAAQIVEYALTGHVEMLTRYGIVSREAAANIHTVEQAMDALEKATSGEAAKRSTELAGAFGRLGNSVALLAESFGEKLIPYFDAVANGLAHVADAFAKLPDWVQQAAAGVTFVTLALTALGLLLPATKLAVEFIGNAFSLLASGANIAWKALGLLSDLVAVPLINAFKGLISYVAQAVTAIGTDLVGAEAGAALGASEFIAPVIAVTAAIAGLIAIVVLLTGHWQDTMKFLNTAWDEFYTNILTKGDQIRRILYDIGLALNPATSGEGIGLLAGDLSVDMPKTSASVASGAAASIDWLKQQFKNVVDGIANFFGANLSNIAIPKPPFEGTIPGRGGKKSGKTPDGKGEATVYFDVPQQAMQSTAPLEQQLEDLRHREAMAQASSTLTPVQSAKFAEERAAIEEEIARIKEANALRALENAQMREKTAEPNSAESQKAHNDVIKAQEQLAQAHVAVAKAADQTAEALRKLTVTTNEYPTSFGDKLGDALANFLARNVPGLQVKQNDTGGFGGFKFDWVTILIDAFSKTKAFADIMKVVNELMQVFADIIDAFRPIIDLLLKGVIFVANGFIDLWNVIATILNLFGLHVQKLQQLSYNLDQASAPFIKIVHDIPTLNELASGNIAPLYPSGAHDTIYNNITDPINNQLKDPTLGGGLLGVLGEILSAVLGLKLVMGLFGGGGGGLLGGLFKGFSFHGVTGLKGLEAALGGIHIGAATLGSTLLAAAGGAVLGDFVGKLFGGGSHSTFGAIGGALGGGLGATLGMFGLAAGPLGALAGAGLGALVGSLFGHAAPNAHDNPDIVKTGDWGWFLANFGADNGGKTDTYDQTHNQIANGQSFNIDSQISQLTGGSGIGAFIAQYVKSHSSSDLSKLFGADASSIASMFSGWDSRGMHDGKNGNMMIGNQTFYWTDIEKYGQEAFQDIVNAMQGASDALNGAAGNILGVAGNITRFVDTSTNELASQVAATSNATAAVAAAAAQAVTNTMAGGSRSVPGGLGAGVGAGGQILITGDNHFYNETDMDQLGKRLTLAQMRAQRLTGYRLDRISSGGPLQ
jgi:hypothetical protein